MIQLNAKLHSIDYSKLLNKVQKQDEKGLPHWLIRLLGELLTGPISGLAKSLIPKKKVEEFAREYGLLFTKLEINGIALIKNKSEDDYILSIFINVENVDWKTFASFLSGKSKKYKEQNNTTTSAAIEIIKPFINNTMATVPLSVIIELFDLIGQDKIIKLAEGCGVTVSSIKIKPGK